MLTDYRRNTPFTDTIGNIFANPLEEKYEVITEFARANQRYDTRIIRITCRCDRSWMLGTAEISYPIEAK